MNGTVAQLGTTISGQIIIPAIAIVLAATAVGIWHGLRKLLAESKATRQVVKDDRSELYHRLDMQDARLEAIEHETQVNSGKSLKDAVLRVEGAVNVQTAILTQHIVDANGDKERFNRYIDTHP